MARIAPILKALRTAFRRQHKSLASITTNYFFLASLFLLRQAGAFVFLIIGLVLLFPLSTDPLRMVPPERLESWPLTKRDRWWLRALTPWLNTVTWILAALAIWGIGRRLTIGVWGSLAALAAIGFVAPSLPFAPRQGVWHRLPNFPGSLNQLIRKNLRELMSTLDFYCALILSVAASLFRALGPSLPHEALLPISLLLVLALSSHATCLFGLEGGGGMTRYCLLPVRGWQLLVAKDLPVLLVIVVLASPLAPLSALSGMLIALAIGHAPSVSNRRDQTRWRFSSGASIGLGILQLTFMSMAAAGTFYRSGLLVLPCCVIFAASLFWHGRLIEQSQLHRGA